MAALSHPLSDTAMVLAAGFGLRMRPLTLDKPKPLLEVGGRTMLDHALDKLVGANVKRAVVNVHYLADQIVDHLKSRTDIDIVIQHETEILETGGGIKQALPHFGGLPFFALNADLPWIDGPTPSLERMRQNWNPEIMDAQLLLMPTAKALGFAPQGDFFIAGNGQLKRHDTHPPRPYVMISAQILKPQAYDGIADKVFSNNLIWNRAEAQQRLFGSVNDGACYHIGTPDDWRDANARLTDGRGWAITP